MGQVAKIGKDTIKLRTYNFPQRGNQAEDYHLMVNGEKLGNDRVKTTSGGGKNYTYIKTKEQVGTNQAFWFEGIHPAGTVVTLEEVADQAPKPPKAAAAAPAAAAPAPAAAPAAPAKQRPAAKPKK